MLCSVSKKLHNWGGKKVDLSPGSTDRAEEHERLPQGKSVFDFFKINGQHGGHNLTVAE